MSQPAVQPLSVAITGASGLIGARASELFRQSGHSVMAVHRLSPSETVPPDDAAWKPDTGEIVFATPPDVLIHLAGRNIATRWTSRAKHEIRESRGSATERLCRFLAQLPQDRRPGLLISASAVGIYGDRGDEVLTETSPLAARGSSFLADVGLDWEAATKPAQDAGIRVILPRIGVVLAKDGGAIAKLLTPSRLGLAGPVGPGTQFIPWISLTDLSRLLLHLATAAPDFSGPVNAVAPPPGSPTRQHAFIRTLGHVLHRPTIFPMPGFMVRLAFGQMGRECLLSSLRVTPTRIPGDFTFLHPTLESALRDALRTPA